MPALLKQLLAKLTGTENPLTSLTYMGLAILLIAPDALQHYGLVDLAKPSEIAGFIMMTLGIRRRLPA